MHINYLNSDGIHQREIKAINILKDKLPDNWFAFASMELVDQFQKNLEIDIAIVMEDRILLADIKDWFGNISSSNDLWLQNGKSKGRSPARKISDNAKILATELRKGITRPQLIPG